MTLMKTLIKRWLVAFAAVLAVTPASMAATPTTVTHPGWVDNAVIYEVNVRQYTHEGTFKAFAGHLPRLKELGVDILWFMPIHPISEKNRKGNLGSYYAVRDYKGVNPEFGTLQDFKDVIDRAHALGMKVVIDWVPNHTGCDNVWTREHPDWYARDEKGQMYGPFDWTDTYKLDYTNPDMRAAMQEAMTYWIGQGVDGFRCDVASEVPVDFWDATRPLLDRAKGEPVFMLAEASVPALEANAFDMAYNWPMKDLYSDIAWGAGQYTFVREGQDQPRPRAKAGAADIITLCQQQLQEYPAGSMLMNMTSNHDLNSWEGTEFERLGVLAPALAAISYTLPGMPLIYTGQEVGLNHALQFFEKDPVPDWTANEATVFYTMLNRLKHTRPELNTGSHTANTNIINYRTNSPDVLVYERRLGDSRTIVAANLGANPTPVAFTGKAPDVTGAVNVLYDKPFDGWPDVLVPGDFLILTIN